jgi:DNA-binding transcriptional LysR family regulator
MELRQLRYLVALADERHFTRAAARERIAQPALSQQIRKLELEVGVALFDRTTRHVSLTEAGALLAARGRRVLAELDDASAELQQLTGLMGGEVTIGLTQTPGPLDVVAVLSEFHARHPAVKLTVREALSTALADELRADTLELGFLSIVHAADRHGLETRPLASEPLVAIVAHAHRLAARKRLRVHDLREEELVAFPPGATIRDAVHRAAGDAGFAPRIAFETSDVSRTRAIVAAGLAVAVLPRSHAVGPGPPVAAIPLHRPTLTHDISLCWREGRRHPPAARALLEQALG